MQKQLIEDIKSNPKECEKLFNQLKLCLIPNSQQKKKFSQLIEEEFKKTKKKNIQEYSILNLNLSEELVADLGLLVIEELECREKDAKVLLHYREIERSLNNKEEKYDPSEIIKLHQEYPVKIPDEEIYDFLMDANPPKNLQNMVDKITATDSIKSLNGELVQGLLNILNQCPSKVSEAKDDFKDFVDNHECDEDAAEEIFQSMKGHLLLSSKIQKKIDKFRSETIAAEIAPLIKSVKKKKVLLEFHDQDRLSTIKEQYPKVTLNDLKFMYRMSNIIKTKTKNIQEAESAYKRKFYAKNYVKNAPKEFKQIVGKGQFPMTCKPVFERIKNALQLFPKLSKKQRKDAKQCMLSALKLIKNKDRNFVELEVQIFTFAFNVNAKSIQIMSVLKMQEDMINYKLEKSSVIIIESTTGSGKTLMAPAIFMQKALLQQKRKYFVMTQPSYLDISEKHGFFTEHYGFPVFIHPEKLKIFASENEDKPALLLLNSYQAIKFLVSLDKKELNNYIFCIDESHSRTVENDVLYCLAKGKVPLVMMSATPDKIFGESNFICHDPKLYPVEEIKVSCKPGYSFIETFNQTLNIMVRMKQGKIKPGHILVFTSGNQFSKNILKKIFDQTDVPVLKVNRISNESKENYMKRLDNEIRNSKSKDFLLLPIQMAGYLETWEKSFVRSTPKKYSKVIKLIVSTNALETSMTIDGLRCVIDSGVYNNVKYDLETGIKTIEEQPITQAMQQQRAGRVGRLSPGISVQITTGELEKTIVPEINRIDLGQAILLMRGVHVFLEKLPLPTKPSKEEFDKQLQVLRKNKIIDGNGELTEKGNNLSIFANFAPFIGSSILDYDEDPKGRLFAFFLSLIITNCSERTIESSVDASNFFPESDIVTIATTLLEAFPTGVGIFKNDYLAITRTMKQNVSMMFPNAKDKIDLHSIQNMMKEYLNGKTILQEVNRFIKILAKENPNWIKIRKINNPEFELRKNGQKEVKYDTSITISVPAYKKGKKGRGSTTADPSSSSKLVLSGRPLWPKHLTVPTECYVFSIKKDEVKHMISGCLIHMTGGGLLPEHMKIPSDLFNPFGHALIYGYLSSSPDLFNAIDNKVVDFENSDIVFMSSGDQNRTKQEINNAFNACLKIMMFTPRSLIIRGVNPRCHCEMIGIGSQDSTTKIYADGDHPHAYRLDKKIINSLCKEDKLKEMEKKYPKYRICMTAEGFNAFTTEKISDPTTEGDSIYCSPNHLFLIAEPFIASGRSLIWECLSDPMSTRERLSIFSSRNIKGNECKLYVVYKKGPLKIFGDEKMISKIYKKEIEDNKEVEKEVNNSRIAEVIAKNCIKDNSLLKEIQITEIKGSQPLNFRNLASTIKFIEANDNVILNDKSIIIFSSTRNKGQILYGFEKETDTQVEIIDGVQVSVDIKSEKLNQIVDSFGCMIMHTSNKEFFFYNTDIAIAFMNKVNFECMEAQKVALNLPDVPRSFYSYQPTREIINDWVKNHVKSTGTSKKLTMGNLMIKDMDIYTVHKNEEDKELIIPKNKKWLFLKNQSDHSLMITRAEESDLKEVFPDNKIDKQKGTIFVMACTKTIHSVSLLKMKKLTPINPKLLWFANFNPENDDKILQILRIHFPFNPKTTNIEEKVEYPVSLDGPMILGSKEEIHHLLDLYPLDPITKFPYKLVPIRKFRKNKVKPNWYVDQISRSIIVPETDEKEAIKAFSGKDDKNEMELLFCAGICNESRNRIATKVPVYQKDKSVTYQSMCHDCVLSLFQSSTNKFFVDQKLKMNDLSEIPVFPLKTDLTEDTDDVQYPQIPFGRLLMSLITEEDIAPYVRAWIAGRIQIGLNFSGRCTSCPVHDKTIFFIDLVNDSKNKKKKVAKTFQCPVPGCEYVFDGPTRQWHKKDEPVISVKPKVHCCPRCHAACIKTDQCNMIKCACGCYWCSLCPIGKEEGFNREIECDYHIRKVHKHEKVPPLAFYERKTADIMFLIDATGSMGSSIQAAHDKAREIAEDFTNKFPDTQFRFGSVCYRDPVDTRNDKHEVSQLDADIGKLINFLSNVRASGGGDGPEDFVGAFDIALNKINWGDGAKNIVLIADAPAHGKRFCGYDNHEDQTDPFVNLIKEVARRTIFISCISIGTYPINCFKEMEKIYNDNNGPSFSISPFTHSYSTSIPLSQQIGKKLHDETCAGLNDSISHCYPD